jgi:uncharacterized protein (TIGR02145 family)
MNFQKFTTFKTILIALVLIINANQLFAQTTNGIFFQAVARDNFSNPAKDRKIYVQSSIIQTTPTGTKVLTEEHQANTDATGVFSISLGNGVRVGGTAIGLATIDWSKGPFYLNLKVAITPIGGNSNWDYNKEWVDMGTTSFGAVPFALYSASSAKVDDKLNATDTTKMLAVYAKAIKVQSLETAVASKLTAADTLTMLAPYAKAAYTIDSSFFKAQLATKLSIADSTKYVTASQLASYNFSSGGTTTTTSSVTMDTTSLSNRINLKANTSDLTSLNTSVTSNTASITANATAINLKAPIASPLFTGTVGIGTANPSSAAALDITSTTQGFLLPRLTYVQKTAIVNPVAGLILFCSDCGTSGEMQLYNGTSFVNMIGANAQFALPVISSTTGAYSITTSSAISGGVISSDGGASITDRGLVWGTSAGSSTFSVTTGTGTGTFTSSITGLTSGITYYIRAFATNSVGTKYGSEITLNTAQAVATLAATTTVSAIGSTTAVSGGNITYNGGATVTASGVVWSTTSTPTIALATKTTDGAASGTYTSNITGLTPGTLYYVRSYATNSVGTSYGSQTSFTTLNTATIAATVSATSITSNSATTGGDITADGGATVTSRGLVYGTTTGSATFSVTSGTGTGTYSIGLTGLSPATTYYVRSFATNSVGTVYGAETNFTTIAVEPTVSATAVAASITGSSATSGGTISSNGGSIVTVSGVVWSTTSTPTIALLTKTTNGALTGTYTSSLTGLAPATLYYVRAYATNSIGTAYGPQSNFTTLAIAPTISGTASATSITSSSASVGGTITSDGGAAVTARGVVYGTSSLSSTFSVTSGTGTGTYSIGLTGLSPATTFYVRSFATNSVGTVYGTETNFTTIAIAPTLTTTAASSITKYAASAGGTITSNGGSAITASGICWSTTATPTISDSKTTDGTTSGTFTSSITGLTAGTTYYVRAYATNAIGTSYGANESFTTLSTPPSQTTVLIGTQRWTDKHLNVANYRNGDPITYAANAAQWAAANAAGEGAYTYLKYASGDGGATYGKLYNWYAVNSSKGLAPEGYHVPTVAEWITLRNTQPLNGTTLKSNTNDWSASFNNVNNFITYIPDANYSNYNGTNSTGFNALPGGSIFPNGNNGNYGSSSLWTATPDGSDATKAEWMYFHSTYFYVGKDCCFTYEKGNGMSVRLVKDNNGLEASPTNPILATTTTATSITANSAILGGNITDEGATQVSVRGLVYGTTTGASTFSVTVGSGGGTFTSTLTGLSQGTTYFVRSFATNAQGTSYGAETSFTTQTTPTVSVTATPISITTTTAIGGGTISSTGGATITTSGLVWGASTNPEITLTTKTTNGTTSGTFTSSITGLTQGTTYYVRAYATNSIGTGYGPNITFTTVTTPTISSTATVTSISTTSATSGGTITVDGGSAVTARGIVWGTTPNPTIALTTKTTDGTGTGTFASNLTGLTNATLYYVRSYATNAIGTVYGTEISFTTLAVELVPTKVALTRASIGTAYGLAFSTQPQVTIQDESGSTVTNSSALVTATISSGGTLVGTITATASSGVATFSDLGIKGTATTYTITYTVSGLTTATQSVTPTALAIGSTGPGGGKVFYAATSGFACGPNLTATCYYLEVAPIGANTMKDWAVSANRTSSAGASGTVIGSGYQNTMAIINQGNSNSAAAYAQAYRGGSLSDWYLGSTLELYQIYLNRSVIVVGTSTEHGFAGEYWTSTEPNASQAYSYDVTNNSGPWPNAKGPNPVRPIRSF